MIIYAALIFYLSSQETIPAPQLFANQDKVVHLAEYAPFGWFSLKAFTPATPAGFLAGVGFSLAYAASDEVHQSFVPGRDASIMDWLADAVGILIPGYIYGRRYKYI
ncbi:VanZ family protein [Candidatus Methanoperedens nitratireducens]|uniref:VanZ family protein n=1 Tax=Candidatus Methanoperedens nitratireducens TaxID=1392998 RepID=A0A284VNW6_9EURY